MSEPRQYDVFLSYSSHDQPWVREFTSALREEGVKGWFDAHDIKPGDRWQDRVEEALRGSRTLVMVLTSDSVNRPWTFFELGAAVADGKRIVPVLAENVEISELPPLVRQYQFVREQSPQDAARKVAEAVHHVELADV
ncbi:MAG TPA: toll/interleukin-1 receptor domain-containing protein [Thermoanaerobaculia bacterium]|jgi:hypothetical protein